MTQEISLKAYAICMMAVALGAMYCVQDAHAASSTNHGSSKNQYDLIVVGMGSGGFGAALAGAAGS